MNAKDVCEWLSKNKHLVAVVAPTHVYAPKNVIWCVENDGIILTVERVSKEVDKSETGNEPLVEYRKATPVMTCICGQCEVCLKR
jgi:hypothetical protein